MIYKNDMIKAEKTLDRNAENERLDGVFGMFLFFGTLKNTWLFVNVRIRKNFLHYYNLDTNMAKQPRIICCCDPLFELCLSAL